MFYYFKTRGDERRLLTMGCLEERTNNLYIAHDLTQPLFHADIEGVCAQT